MLVYMWRCSRCHSISLMTAGEQKGLLSHQPFTCGFVVQDPGGAQRTCNGIWRPFIQFAAEPL